MKTLVVFYSRTNTTTVVAGAIARACGADVERVRDRKSREGSRGYVRSFVEGVLGRPGAIEPTVHDPAAYDLVIVGTPVWCSAVSSPIRAWLESASGRLPHVAFFCTFGGTGSQRAFAQMTRVVGRAPIATLDVRADSVAAGSYTARVLTFARQLVPAAASRHPAAAAFDAAVSASPSQLPRAGSPR